TGRRMSLGERPAAGKTGTTNDATAVWFTGFTRQLAAAVWAGYPDGSRPLKDVTVQGVTYDLLFGAALPGPIWHDAMAGALKGEKIRRLVLPVPDCEARTVPSDLQERCAADPSVQKSVRKKTHEQAHGHAQDWIGWNGPG
ncbi:MAG TPA: hypothetical protein VNC22_20045, partial [Sporichthya sp.]|nr:hypothetical protein [Sporichthya sp.]